MTHIVGSFWWTSFPWFILFRTFPLALFRSASKNIARSNQPAHFARFTRHGPSRPAHGNGSGQGALCRAQLLIFSLNQLTLAHSGQHSLAPNVGANSEPMCKPTCYSFWSQQQRQLGKPLSACFGRLLVSVCPAQPTWLRTLDFGQSSSPDIRPSIRRISVRSSRLGSLARPIWIGPTGLAH